MRARESGQRARATRPRRTGLLLLPLALLVLGTCAAFVALERLNVAPRQLGPYLERRASGHNPAIENSGRWLGRQLVALDRAEQPALPALRLGMQDSPADGGSASRVVMVASEAELRAAMDGAQPGDAITLLPGRYRISAPLDARVPGRAEAPITVRASRPDSVTLEQDSVEGFRVNAPYWRFENLTIRGACGDDNYCEHAFHIVGGAHHVAVINNMVVDFNAHLKINGENGTHPDHGLIEANTLTNTRARVTYNPVTPIDIVTASDWTIRRNLISD